MNKERYYTGIEQLKNMNFSDARKAFLTEFHLNRDPGSLDYLYYCLLLESRYRDIAKTAQKYTTTSGFSQYSLYWFHFMTGEIDELQVCLNRMLSSDNYFLRVFAVREMFKRKELHDADAALRENVLFSGLTYGMQLEERRAAVYLDLLAGKTAEAVAKTGALLKEYWRNGDVYIDYLDALESNNDKDFLRKIITDPVFTRMCVADYRVLYSVSRVFYRLGMYDRSVSALKNLLGEFRHNPLFYYNLGNCYCAKKDLVKAIAAYEEAIGVAPLFERAYYNAGTVYLKLGAVKEAIEKFEEAVKICRRPDTLYNLAYAMIELKKLPDAYHYLAKIPKNFSDKYQPGKIRQKIKDVLVFG